ncbi:hypothetical protein ES708_06176 [subsurface metagenome]
MECSRNLTIGIEWPRHPGLQFMELITSEVSLQIKLSERPDLPYPIRRRGIIKNPGSTELTLMAIPVQGCQIELRIRQIKLRSQSRIRDALILAVNRQDLPRYGQLIILVRNTRIRCEYPRK